MLGSIPAVLNLDMDKNFSKAGMMEGTVFVMLRLTKMFHTTKTQYQQQVCNRLGRQKIPWDGH